MKFGGSKSVDVNSGQLASSQNGAQTVVTSTSTFPIPNGYSLSNLRVLRVSDERDACIEGLAGSFIPVENDFTRHSTLEQLGPGDRIEKHFRNELCWDSHKRERVKRFRFVICFLGLCAASLALMSRAILNVCIVDMVSSDVSAGSEDTTPSSGDNFNITTGYEIAESYGAGTSAMIQEAGYTLQASGTAAAAVSTTTEVKFQWSMAAQNTLLGSFHTGYIPSMLVGGGIANKYGAKYPLFVCVFGSFVINFLTPHLARHSIQLLIGSRVLLGILHGGLVPSIYQLFNKWLTMNETSIFVPLIKVSLSAGIFMGSMLPGVMASFGYQWPRIFYMASFLCFIWSILWLLLATSTPQTNRLVRANELNRIIRKKEQQLPILPTISITEPSNKHQTPTPNSKTIESDKAQDSIPWLLIITSPSVIVLTFVKFTYNLGMEIWGIELAVYLREIHGASTTTISAIASGGALLQMALTTPIGWSARIAVERNLFGFNRTGWRKLFQGFSNFSMAAIYLLLPLLSYDIIPAATLIVTIHLLWVFGAGGESMVPYDLSSRYPATIMGFAHAISVLSGVTVPLVCGLFLGNNGNEPDRWNLLFLALAGTLCAGGLAFCLIFKAEPFLPGEKKPKAKEDVKK